MAVTDDARGAQGHRGRDLTPIARAVRMLITSSTDVGCSTGISPAFAPFRIRSTK